MDDFDDFDLNATPTKKGKILIVDDDATASGVLEAFLEDDFEMRVVNSGEACLQVIQDFGPDLVLMDIEMPGMDGYATCAALQQDLEDKVMPVIFISSHDTLEERLKAYESGGMDFITKPFDPDELMLKAEKLIILEADRRQKTEAKDSMQKMAMDFLTNMGEIGAVLQFLRNCYTCTDNQSLANMTMEAIQQYGLNCHVQIRTASGPVTYTPQGLASPLEESVIDKVRGLDRIFQFKTHMVVNYEHVSVLITNMPLANPDLCGRIRDNAATIAEGAESSAMTIANRAEADARSIQLKRAADRTREALEGLSKQYKSQQNSTSGILRNLADKMDKMYMSLGLTDSQEAAVDAAVKSAVSEALVLFDTGLDFDGQFTAVLEELKKIT